MEKLKLKKEMTNMENIDLKINYSLFIDYSTLIKNVIKKYDEIIVKITKTEFMFHFTLKDQKIKKYAMFYIQTYIGTLHQFTIKLNKVFKKIFDEIKIELEENRKKIRNKIKKENKWYGKNTK